MKHKLTKEQLKMQKIAGILTESEYLQQMQKEEYTEPQIPAEPLFLDLEKEGAGKGIFNQAIKDAIQAQKFLKRLLNTRLDPRKQKMLTKAYLEKMKHEGLLYPGIFTENQTGKKTLNEGDFDTVNNVMAVINQLLEMGDEGERVLAILERIPEWNELVSNNQDIDM